MALMEHSSNPEDRERYRISARIEPLLRRGSIPHNIHFTVDNLIDAFKADDSDGYRDAKEFYGGDSDVRRAVQNFLATAGKDGRVTRVSRGVYTYDPGVSVDASREAQEVYTLVGHASDGTSLYKDESGMIGFLDFKAL